jgi:opacity protein-like surface antigen
MKKLAIIAALAACTLAAPALAQVPPHWYVGAGAGVGKLNISGTDLTGLNNAQVDDSEVVYTVRGGWRFHPFMGIELGYYDLGKFAFHGSGVGAVDGTARAKSVGLSFVAFLPINPLDVYARVGIASSELKVNASTAIVGTPANAKDKQTEATYGVGMKWYFARDVAVFAEWMKNDKIQVDSYQFGIDFKF